VCVQLYEVDKVSCGLFSLQRPMIKIVGLCDPDSLLSLVIYTSTILVYFTWLNKAIRVLVCVQLYEADNVSCGLFLLQRPMVKNCGTM
jgi:hypothetical protein